MNLQYTGLRTQSRWIISIVIGLFALIMGMAAGALVVGIPNAMTLFVIVVGLFALLASVARVEWGLLVLVFITYTRFSDIAIAFHGAPSTAKSFIALLILAIFFRWVVYGERPQGWQRPVTFLAAFGLIIFASLLYAANPERTQSAVEDFIKNAAIVIIIAILLQRKQTFYYVIWTLLGAGMFMGSLSVFQYFTSTFDVSYGGFAQSPMLHIIGERSGPRVAGPIGDPNFYAQIMLVMVPLALDRLWSEKKRLMKLIALWALVVCSLTIVLTFSRGAFLAMALSIIALFIFRPPPATVILISLALLLLVLPFIPSEYVSRMLTITDLFTDSGPTHSHDASFRGRTSELMVGWLMFVDHPILGVGLDNYPAHYQEYSRRVGLDPRLEERAAHNLYIEYAAELGLLGLAAFGLILWGAFNSISRAYRSFKIDGMKTEADMVISFGVSLSGYLMAAMFISDAFPRFMWLLIGISLSLLNVAKNETGRVG